MIYHCDYCNRDFPYNNQNIKKHNFSKQHLILKANYYKKFQNQSNLIMNTNQHLENWLNSWPLYTIFTSFDSIPPSILTHYSKKNKAILEWG